MSNESAKYTPIPVLQPLSLVASAESTALHPLLQQQVHAVTGSGVVRPHHTRALLDVISAHYDHLDQERRGVVRSMQLLAAEANARAAGNFEGESGHLQAILDHVKDVVITVDAEGTVRLANPTAQRVFGFSEAELVGQGIARLLPDLAILGNVSHGLVSLAVRPDSQKQDLRPREFSARHQNGQRFPVELTASRVVIDERDMFVLCLRDTSERKLAEQALRDSEARYRTLVESAPEYIILLERDTGRCVDANERALRLFGVERARLRELRPFGVTPWPEQVTSGLGVTSTTIIDPDTTDAALGSLRVFPWTHRDANGRTIDTEVRLMALPGAPGLLRATITDVTQRRRHEQITAGERNLFERMAAGATLPNVLRAIVGLLEAIDDNCCALVAQRLPDARYLANHVFDRLPEKWVTIEAGMAIEPGNGSSAACAAIAAPVLVGDIDIDPRWRQWRTPAGEAGFKAAWAVPILDAQAAVIGVVTLYRSSRGEPSAADLSLLQHAAKLAGIAIERSRSESALVASESQYRSLYERILEGVYQLSATGAFIEVNPALVKMLGYDSAADVCRLPGIASIYRNPSERAEFERVLDQRGEVRNAEFELVTRSGETLVVLESARILRDAGGRTLGFEGTLSDITARKRAEQAVVAEKDRALVTLQSIGDAVITTDANGRIDYMNPGAEKLTGWQGSEALGQPLAVVLPLRDESTLVELEDPVSRCLRGDSLGNVSEHTVLHNRFGHEIGIHDSAAPIRDYNGVITGVVVVFRDVTKERRLRRALSYQASHDALTGLINRREFDNRIGQALESVRSGARPWALMYLDLDQFKVVNDTCGHPAGDRLLREVTALLQSHVRASDVIARLGGDEFGILMRECSAEQAATLGNKLRQAIKDHRFVWEGTTSCIGVSIGVVQISTETETVASILSAADIACYAAKEAGRNRVHLYDSGEVTGKHREMYWVSRVTRAIEEGRLELFSQQIVATGFEQEKLPDFQELLVRLRSETGVLVLPGEFIPAAERYNVVPLIDRWVVEQAVRSLRARQASQSPPVLLAVNLSGLSLSERSFLEFVMSQTEDRAIASGLCFEVTESALITNLEQAIVFMHELKKRGCRFALDDFGTGMSSFQYLKRLPVDFLKIDGEFVSSITTDRVDRSVVFAVTQVASALGIATIAERVESAEVYEELKRLQVPYVQGRFLGWPAPFQGG